MSGDCGIDIDAMVATLSHPQAVEFLERRGLDPAFVLGEYEHLPLKTLALQLGIGHVNLRKVLEGLGVTMGREAAQRKRARTQQSHEMDRWEQLLHQTPPDDLVRDLTSLHPAEFAEKHGVPPKWRAALAKHLGISLPSPQTLVALRQRQTVEAQLPALMERGMTLPAMAGELGCRVPWLREVVRGIDAQYIPRLKAAEGDAQKDQRLRDAHDRMERELPTIMAARYDDLVPGHLATLGLPRNLRTEALSRSLVEAEDAAILRWIGGHRDDALDPRLNGEWLHVPERFSTHATLYRAWAILNEPISTRHFLEHHRFSTVREFADLVPRTDFPALCAYFQAHGLDGLLHPPVPMVEQRAVQVAGSLGIDRNALAKELEELPVRSMDELARLLGFGVTQTRSLLNHVGSNMRFTMSLFGDQVARELDGMGVTYQHNTRQVLPSHREVDFHIPQAGIALEINPTYTHNSAHGWGKDPNLALPRNYHAEKTREAWSQGIELISLYGRDLDQGQWERTTLPFLRFKLLGPDRVFHGREVLVEEVTRGSRLSRPFLEEHHLQGARAARHHYRFRALGTGEVLGWATFGKPVGTHHRGMAELVRLAFLPDVQVRFGLSKVLAQFRRDHGNGYGGVFSYSRNDMGSGRAYAAAGFTLEGDTGPNLSWVNPDHPLDCYSWAAATPWSAREGILARALGSQVVDRAGAEGLMATLPWREGQGAGYVPVWGSGSRIWSLSWTTPTPTISGVSVR